MGFIDAVGEELHPDDRVAYLSTFKTKTGNKTVKGTVVGFTQKLVSVQLDGEENIRFLNNYQLVVIKNQDPFQGNS